jgi:hypothetical protein
MLDVQDRVKSLDDEKLATLAALDVETLQTLGNEAQTILQQEACYDRDEPQERVALLDMAKGVGEFVEAVIVSSEVARQELADRKAGAQ